MGISSAVYFYYDVYAEQLGCCEVCDKPMVLLHHIVPRSVGGGDARSNIVGLCASCHSSLHAQYNRLALDVAHYMSGDRFFSDALMTFTERKKATCHTAR